MIFQIKYQLQKNVKMSYIVGFKRKIDRKANTKMTKLRLYFDL